MPSSIQDLLGRTRRLKSELSQTSTNSASPWSKQAKQALDELCNIEAILQDFTVGDTQSAEFQGLVDALQALELDTQRALDAIRDINVIHRVYIGYSVSPPHLQPATSRLAGANSAHLPRHGPAVATATERASTGSLAPLLRVNSHSWLSEHLHPSNRASEGAIQVAFVPRTGRSPFDLDTQPLVDAFPIQPSASVSVHEDALQAAGSCGVGTPETLELEDTIGEGGFGVVYKGRVRGPQGEVQVAIKTLKMQVMSPEDKAQFRDESILHIKLRHRNVVRCFAVWDDEPPIKMILEYSEIGSLHRLLRDASREHLLTWTNKLQWAKDIAEGLKYLHDNRILHGDIKSHNILLFMQQPGEQLTAKLTDFGMAKVRAAANNTTNIDTRKGTVAWQPPEAFKSEVRPLKSDVYSFAMVLYELVTGKTPFHDLANVSMILNAIVQQKRPSLEGYSCPPPFRKLIEDCWVEEPEMRPDFEEVCMRLQGMLDTPAPLLHYVDDVGLDTTCSIDEFKCPVTLEVMVDPVIIETGITYERATLEQWFAKGKDTCPMTGQKLTSTQVIPNIGMRQRIERWREAMQRAAAAAAAGGRPPRHTSSAVNNGAPSSPAANAARGASLAVDGELRAPAPLAHVRPVRPTAGLRDMSTTIPASAFDQPPPNGAAAVSSVAISLPRIGAVSPEHLSQTPEHPSSSSQLPVMHSHSNSRPSSDGNAGRSSTSRLLQLRNSRLALLPAQQSMGVSVGRTDLPRVLRDLKGDDARFIAAAERLSRLTMEEGDSSGYLVQHMSRKELVPLVTVVGNAKQLCATKRVAMEAIGNLAMLNRVTFDQLVKANAVGKVAEHLGCHEAACQHAATVALHMLLEAWNLYGAGRSSEHGDGGLDEDAVSSPMQQYKIPQFKKHFFASARPLPYNVCKEAGPLLLALIIRTSSCTVTQELAADIIIEIARDPSRANKLHINRAIPAALRLLTVPGASDALRLKGLTLLQRMTVPEVSLCKEQHRHLQATIIKSIMAYTGEALYDGCEGEPVVSAIASQVCASNTVLSERATLLLCTLACTDEYRLMIAHAKASPTPRASNTGRQRTPSVVESALSLLTPDYTQGQQVAAVKLLHRLAVEASGGASVAIVQRRGIQDLGVYVSHPEQYPEGRLLALCCLVAIARQVQHQRLMIMSNLVPALVSVARLLSQSQQSLKYEQLAQLACLMGHLSPYDDASADVPVVVAEGGLQELVAAYRSEDPGCKVEAGLALAKLAARSSRVLERIYETRLIPSLVNTVKAGQGAPQGKRPSAYEVRGAAAALLAELAQREQYKDEILAAELVPHLLVLLDARLKDEGCTLSACRALAALSSSPSAQCDIACNNGLPLLVDLLFRPQEQQFALTVIKEVSEGTDSISGAPLYLQEIMHAKAVPPLISIALDQPSPVAQAASLRVLRQLCIDERCRATVMQGGSGARALVEGLRGVPDPAVKLDCVNAIADIASEQRYCHLLEGGVSCLVELLDQRAWPHKTQACRCLRNLALGSPSLQRAIVERGCARHLATLLTSNDAAARLAASEAVVALAVGRQAVCQDALTATEPLVRALVSLLTGPEATSVQAVIAIRHLSDANHRSTIRLLQASVVPPLAELLQTQTATVQRRAPSIGQGTLVASPSLAIAGTPLLEDISHALSIAETLGVLCKDDRARMEVTKQEHMRVVIPALVELARHCPPTDMEAVLNTLALLAQNQPQAQLLMVQEGLVPRLTGAWVQHRTAPGAAVGALKCAVSLGACTEFLAQLDARLAAQYLLEIMLAPKQLLLQQQGTEALKTLLTYSADVRKQVLERVQPFLAACSHLLQSSDKVTLQAAFWSMYIMIKCHTSMADRVAQDRHLAAQFQRLARPASASLLGPEYLAYAVEIFSELQQRNPHLLRA